MKPVRIGKIAFTNILPLYHYFHYTDLPVELIPQVPSQLNKSMAEGRIDMGPISSFAYADDFPKYVIMPDLSVSAKGRVGSIFLFSKRKSFADVKNGKIALTNTSASSVNLLKILLEHFAGGTPSYKTEEPNLDQMMEHADAALLIGDDALRANWSNRKYYVFDLGLEWYKETGLPMTFAVWAVNRSVVKERQETLSLVYHRFLHAKRLGEQQPMPVIQEAISQLGGKVVDWEKYYAGLNYNFGPEEQRGLATFYHYAALSGLIKDDVKIEVMELPVHI
ncbi:menaquinone biosynthesis protein [Shimazuella kribbensis]|uniref:menaquinone biosynthesis protein n=1 Tax=Shimazuella kribbensis TaxID=139808 RepID=UPI000413043D|nr:menaquinone biosynthesis protein [Shimazuella kribbensis]